MCTRAFDRLHQVLDIGVPAQVAQLDRIASRQRLEVGRQVIRRRHRRPSDERGNHQDVLVLQSGRDLEAQKVV